MFTKFFLYDHSPIRRVKVLAGKPAPRFKPLATGEDETFRSDRLDDRTGEKDSFLEFHWIWFGLVCLTSINLESFQMIASVFSRKVKIF